MAAEHLVAFNVTPQTPEVRFLASLSDGRTMIQDDRPGELHAWHRLAEFLRANPGIKITCLRLQAPGREVVTPANQPGYVLGMKGTLANMQVENHYLGIGYFDGQAAVINWLRVPDLAAGHVEQKTREQCGFFLIENPA